MGAFFFSFIWVDLHLSNALTDVTYNRCQSKYLLKSTNEINLHKYQSFHLYIYVFDSKLLPIQKERLL